MTVLNLGGPITLGYASSRFALDDDFASSSRETAMLTNSTVYPPTTRRPCRNSAVAVFMTGVFILSLVMISPNTLAQFAGGDGRALDANRSSNWYGRYNQTRTRFKLNNLNNAIVTGNVGGGKHFRGDVGYTGALDFRGQAGSTDLYRDNAGLYGPSLAQQRSSFLQVDQSRRTMGNARYGSSQPSTLILSRSTTGSNVSSARQTNQQRSLQNVSIDPTGSLRMSTQSSMGQRSRRALELQGGDDTLSYLNATRSSSPTEQSTGIKANSGDASSVADDFFGFNVRSSASLSTLQPRGLPETNLQRGTPAQQKAAQEQAATALESSTLIKLHVGDDPYADIIARILAQTNGIVATTDSNLYTDDMLNAVTQFNDQYRERVKRMQDAHSAIFENPNNSAPELRVPNPQEVSTLEIPELDSLSGDDPSVFSVQMQRGEAAIQGGNYFDAEQYFESALQLAPGYPLAQTGKIHAQLGAGLFRSSAAGLRQLLQLHPELAAFRYSNRLIPSHERLQEVIAIGYDLAMQGNLPDGGLLVAYCGNLLNEDETVQRGLALMADRNPSDSLLAILQAAWLPASSPGETVTPSEEPTK